MQAGPRSLRGPSLGAYPGQNQKGKERAYDDRHDLEENPRKV
jgi:hypothetical protein